MNMMADDSKQRPLSDDWYEFTEDVSMHGIRYLSHHKLSPFRKVVWLILILGWLSYLCYAAYLFMDDYTKKIVSTKVSVETAEELQFPTVTVCNKNLWRISQVHETAIGLGTFGFFEIMEDLYNEDRPSPPPADKYNWSSPEYLPITYLVANDTENFFQSSAHPFEESISRCRIYGKHTNCTDLFQIARTEGGYCAIMNADGKITASSAGKTGGVSFLLFTNVAEYTTGPFSNSEGFSITLHEEHEVPLVAELGIGIPPGLEVDFILHKSTTHRKPPPADNDRANCFDAEKLENPLHYFNHYSYSACQVECKTEYVINKCSCRDPLQPPLNDTELCLLPKMLNCSTPSMRNFAADPEGLRSCDCKDACKVSEYSAKIATTRFPSNKYKNLYGIDEETLNFYSSNYILVNIYYGKMSYQTLTEEYAYSITDMIANLGGTLGLCVGASILTVFEFMEFGVRALIKCLVTRRKQNTTVSTIQLKVAPVDGLA